MDSKLQIRNFLIHNSKGIMSIKVLLGSFPIIFGMSKTLFSKYQDQTFSNLFKYNLPGISSTQAQISWLTFEQILSNQLELEIAQSSISNIYDSCIKRVDFYDDSVLIQTNSNWHTKQKQIYIGSFNIFESNISNSKKQIGNNWYTIFSTNFKKNNFTSNTKNKKNWVLLPNYNTKNTTIFYPFKLSFCNKFKFSSNPIAFLDELPTKLNSSYISKQLLCKNLLETKVTANQLKFVEKNKSKQAKKINKKTLFRENEIIPQSSINVKIQRFVTRPSNFELFTNSNSLISSLSLDKFKDQPKKNLFILKGIHTFTHKDEINLTEKNLLDLTQTVFTKNNFIENKLKENFYIESFTPFSNFTHLNFSSDTLVDILEKFKQKSNFKEKTQFSSFCFPYKARKAKQGKENFNLSDNSTIEISLLLKSVVSKKSILYSTEILDFLKLIEKISVFYENPIILPRIMSGYSLPDTSNEQNLSAVTQFFYKKNSKLFHTVFSHSFKQLFNSTLQINLSKNFSYSLNFLNAKFNPPSLKLSSQSQFVNYCFSTNKKKTIYEGPSVVQNKITNELDITNLNQIKQWIKQFLNSDNILTDRREVFFGKNVYVKQKHNPKSDKNTNPSYSVVEQEALNEADNVKVALLTKGRSITFFEMPLKPTNLVTRSRNDNGEAQLAYDELLEPNSIISYDEYPYVIYLDKRQWNRFVEKLSEEKNELIPIANVRFPKQKFISWPLNQFNTKSLNNFISFSHINFNKNQIYQGEKKLLAKPEAYKNKSSKLLVLENGKKTHITNNTNSSAIPANYHYFPYSQTLVKEVLPKKYFFGKVYKKKFSIYKNNSHRFAALFYQPREPISLYSWLFVAQFSIGLFLLHILQNISQKYGREMKYVISSLLEGKNENSNSFNTDLDENDLHENFRLIKNIKKDFRDIAGIDAILPELSEIVWFLRNSGRSFKVGNTIPRRILLTGPPGTGKTLLVQAIAGEAGVPVLIESGSSLNQPEVSEGGSERLKNIFNKAREIAPCIIFIDEIDTFGQARDQMVENFIINNEIINCIYSNDKNSSENNTFRVNNFDFIPQPPFLDLNETGDLNESSNFQDEVPIGTSDDLFNQVNKKVTQNNLSKQRATQEKSNLLMQFLIELDGIATEKKILVFGATNRPQVLDTALTRPGRFNKVLNLNLPNKQKRIEILKLYSKNIGVDTTISWNYLGNLTPGLSAADLASVMNQSSMKAIQAETFHTIQTIEYGIESITGYVTQKNQLKFFTQVKKNVESQSCSPDKFELCSNFTTLNNQEAISKSIFISRLAYYQAGKAIVHTLLKHHPEVISVRLWPQLKNPRYHLVNGIIEKEFSQIRTRIELESRIIGFYGGKAAEFLALFHNNKNSKFFFQEATHNNKSTQSEQISKQHIFLYAWQSDLGVQDISFAGWLAQLMINNWYFYSKQIPIQKFNQFQNNSNLENISDYGTLQLFKQLAYEIETETSRETIAIRENSQNWITKPWLQRQITKKLEFSYLGKNNWYKIYEGDHEENENTRCIQPDEYYHSNVYLNNLLKNKLKVDQTISLPSAQKQSKDQDAKKQFFKSSVTWNDLGDLNRDYVYHSLILTCFNKSISILDKNRELLDFFASYLIQKEVIRENEIINIINTFQKNQVNLNKQQKTTTLGTVSPFVNFFTKQIKDQLKSRDRVKFQKQSQKNNTKSKKKDKIVEKNWGKWSRKKPSKFINFENI